jgi:hypothetical protein
MKQRSENEQRAWEMLKKSIGPRIWSDADLGYFFGAGLLFGILMTLPLVALADDNIITIDQAGDYLDLTVNQEGYDNELVLDVNGSFQGTNAYIDILQRGAQNSIGGLYAGYTIDGNDNEIRIKQYTDTSKSISDNSIQLNVEGQNNIVLLGQGWYINDQGTYNSNPGNGWGDNYTEIDIQGDYNKLIHTQRTDGSSDGATSYIDILADSNDVYAQQRQGQHSLTLTINNDYNEAWITQAGQPSHTANITLEGTYGTDFYLQQGSHSVTTSQSLGLVQQCYTAGGCSLSITQN